MMNRRVGAWPTCRTILPTFAAALLLTASPLYAQATLPPVTVGAGLQTSFVHDMPDGGDSTDRLLVNSVRLYVSGSATKEVKYMFNTEYNSATQNVSVIDA